MKLAQSPPLPLRLGRIRGSAGAWLAAQLRAAHRGPILVIAPGSTRAEEFAAALRAFSPETEVRILPRYDVPPYDRFSAHPEIEARRKERTLTLAEMRRRVGARRAGRKSKR